MSPRLFSSDAYLIETLIVPFPPITQEGVSNDVAELTSTMSNVQIEKVSASPTLKLPQLFSSTPTSSGKGGNGQKRHPMPSQINKMESLSEKNTTDQPLSNTRADNLPTGLLHNYLLY